MQEEMTSEQLAEAKTYQRQQLLCDLADRALDVTYLAVMAFAVAPWLDMQLRGISWLDQNWWLRLAVLFLIVIGGHIVVSFPLSLYAGHVLEHRFKLSRQSLARWLGRYAKRNLLAVAFGLAMVQGLYWLVWFTGPYWWLAAAGSFFLVSIVLGQLAPVLIMPLFYKIERLEDEDLSERFARLSKGTGLSIEGIYRMEMSAETVKANAMLAGLGRTRRVILGDTLLDSFTHEEIEVILAHEIGHHVHRHIPKLMLTGLIYSTASFFLCDRLLSVWIAGDVPYRPLPVYVLPLLMLAITLFSQLLEPLQNSISRHFERQSDRFALQHTHLVDAYRSAFSKLAKLNKADPNPHPLEVFLFDSHPPIAERLAMADRV